MIIIYIVLFILGAIIPKNERDEYCWNSRLIWDTLFWEKSIFPWLITVTSIVLSIIIAWGLDSSLTYTNAETLAFTMLSISFVLLGLTFNYTKPYYYYFSMKEVLNYYGLKLLFIENIVYLIIYSFIKLGLIPSETLQKALLTELIVLNGIIELFFVFLLLGERRFELTLLLQLRHAFQCSDFELHQGDFGKESAQAVMAGVDSLSDKLCRECSFLDKKGIKDFNVLDDKEIKLSCYQKRARIELGIILLLNGLFFDYGISNKMPYRTVVIMVSVIINIMWFIVIIEPANEQIEKTVSMWATVLIPRAILVKEDKHNQLGCKYLRSGHSKNYLDYIEDIAAMMYILRRRSADEAIVEEAMGLIAGKFEDGSNSFSKRYALLVIGYFACFDSKAIKPIRKYFEIHSGSDSELEKGCVLKEVAYLSKRINRVQNKQEYYNVPYFEEYYVSALGKANTLSLKNM